MPDLLSSAGGGATTGAALGSIIPGVGTAVGGIIGGVGGLVVSLFGNSAAKQAALERARRADLSNAATMGKAEAEAGTSGFDQNQGSMAAYLSMMSGEVRRQNDLAVK